MCLYALQGAMHWRIAEKIVNTVRTRALEYNNGPMADSCSQLPILPFLIMVTPLRINLIKENEVIHLFYIINSALMKQLRSWKRLKTLILLNGARTER